MEEQDIYSNVTYYTPSFTEGKTADVVTIKIFTETAGIGMCDFQYDKEHKTVYIGCMFPGTWKMHIVPKHI